ncbi:hypothetical protein [Nocardioides bruguierae]|uniref:WD40 repeat domain-containing protein n=1 Tax=Nocardioides bruguierae TaxID=2945102 RepID=A0A9X2IEF7_9ACTN|nr:hypothetical protein [Nocardioides bruguierae]MCM0620781.1 hypothetical protein [Nocardioides bruguierae]
MSAPFFAAVLRGGLCVLLGLVLALPVSLAGAPPAGAAGDGSGSVVLVWDDPRIIESSGLVDTGRYLVTTNDSGDSGQVFTVAARGEDAGETVGVTTWSDDPTDVEALAPAGRGHVWVGDIGDNNAVRDSIQVARVPVGAGDRTVSPTVYDLVYPDGARDAETLLRHPRTGRLFVVSKELLGGSVYAAPATLDPDGPNELTRVGPVLPIATDGSFGLDGRSVVVRGYFSSVVYAWPSLRRVAEVAMPDQQQGEGIAVDRRGRLLVSTEGRGTEVLRVATPVRVRAILRGDEGDGTAGGSDADEAEPGDLPDPDAFDPEVAADPARAVPDTVPSWILAGLTSLAALLLAGLAVLGLRGLLRRLRRLRRLR